MRANAFTTLLAGLLLVGTPAQAGERIVAAGGVVTEILYALGVAERLVGIDSTSLEPPRARQTLPDIGYVRALSAEGVLSLAPDRVIAVEAAGPPSALALVREAGVPIDLVDETTTKEGVLARIRTIGALVGEEARADALAADVEAGFALLEAARARIERPVRVLFVLSLQNGRVMAGGAQTGADAMIALAGGVNAIGAIEGYKPITDEALIAAAPEFVLVMGRGEHALTAQDVFALPGLAASPAAAEGRLVSMDGLYLLGFGPRTPQAALDLLAALYPSAPANRAEIAR